VELRALRRAAAVMADWWRYAQLLDVNPYHPESWPPDVQAEVARWRLAQFRAHWRWMSARGMPALIRAQSGREALLRQVRAELDAARAPLPTRVYRHCPCHRRRFGLPPTGEPWNETRAPGVPVVLAALSWLRRTFARPGGGA
jgi:hypothetical protein